MKNIIISIAIVVFVLVGVVAWLLFGSATSFKENRKYLYVYTGKADKTAVALLEGQMIWLFRTVQTLKLL